MRTFLIIISSWFLILLLCGLNEQLIRYVFSWRIISTKILSAEGQSWLQTLVGMSSRTYSNIPPPVLLQANLKGGWKPSIKNWPCRKLLSSLVSDIINMSIEPLICLHRRSNLFLRELVFRCSDINLLILLIEYS